MPKCSYCLTELRCISSLWLHLRFVHQAEKSQSFRCQEGDCPRVCNDWSGFRKHLTSRHRCDAKAVAHVETGESSALPNDLKQMPHAEVYMDDSLSSEVESSSGTFMDKVSQLILMFVLSLYANNRLPRSYVQSLLDTVLELLNELLACALRVISFKLKQRGVDGEAIKEVEAILLMILEPFSSYSSEYRRFKSFEKSGYLIPLQTAVVGERTDRKLVKSVMVKDTVAVEAHFLPMRLVLKKIFSMPNVFTTVEKYMKYLYSQSELLENFIQGKLWQDKMQRFFKGKYVIPLFVYFDDFEINNQLRSHVGIHKLGALYYSIPCLPPEINSLIQNVFVAGLFHSADKVSFSNHRIFHTLIDELNYLQEIGIQVEGVGDRIYFALGLILGDNLGLNSVLGFDESFNAKFYCRLCKPSKQEIQSATVECNMRFDSYEADFLLNDYHLTGIKEKCVWDNVRYFKSYFNFAVDWLHDGPEGWGKEIVTLVLHFLVKRLEPKDFRLSLDVLNSRLRSFDYHHNAISNKPPCITMKEVESNSLKMSGCEMQNFILLFSMLVGDMVATDCKEWKLYCQFREIMDIVLCRTLQNEYVALLRTLVDETFKLFKELFPNETIKPKAHNFTHYSNVMEQSGPLISLSTAGFERKHKEKKTQACAITSRKDITYTLMLKEQLNLCCRFMHKNGLEAVEDYSCEKCLDDASCCEDFCLFKNSLPKSFSGPCVLHNWVQINGITYRNNICVVVRLSSVQDDESLPVFGSVDKILQSENGKIIFVCKLLVNYGFSSHFHAYDVSFSTLFDCVAVDDLLSPFPVILNRMGDGSLYATVRHKL